MIVVAFTFRVGMFSRPSTMLRCSCLARHMPIHIALSTQINCGPPSACLRAIYSRDLFLRRSKASDVDTLAGEHMSEVLPPPPLQVSLNAEIAFRMEQSTGLEGVFITVVHP